MGPSTARYIALRTHRRSVSLRNLEAPPGFEPGIEVLQTSALPLGDGADLGVCCQDSMTWLANRSSPRRPVRLRAKRFGGQPPPGAGAEVGAGNGIRTRDFDLGKVALYH